MQKPLKNLKLQKELKQVANFWEAWILLALIFVVFIFVVRGPTAHVTPTSLAAFEPYQREKLRLDPYGIRTEPNTAESRRKVETGL